MRRRLSALAVLTLGIGGLLAVNATTGSAGVLPARQHVQLQKLCPRASMDPTFVIQNVTTDASLSNDNQTYAAEDLLVTLRRGANGPVLVDRNGPGAADDVIMQDIPVAAGQTVVVKVEGEAWDGVIYAEFDALYRGQVKRFSSRQLCHCESGDDVTTTQSTDTTLPDS